MPLYEYQCEICGAKKEIVRGINDPEEFPECLMGELQTDAVDCKRQKMKRVVSSGTSFILKGGGWAKDGYR